MARGVATGRRVAGAALGLAWVCPAVAGASGDGRTRDAALLQLRSPAPGQPVTITNQLTGLRPSPTSGAGDWLM